MAVRQEQWKQSLRPSNTSLITIFTDSEANHQSLAAAAVRWHLSVKVHRDLWVTLTGNDNSPSACTCPVSTVGKPRAPCLSAVCDLPSLQLGNLELPVSLQSVTFITPS
ncbi:hypothetical protein I79_017336 [Cricetulus griseus]|uniref:Uncharacterized protein n=1 Tax=Cricetulus griseus TaxID=10029 RepID=G3I1R7_CRIGR|nr:hypothetical protein I79_017336 [Cricetulus griseus]